MSSAVMNSMDLPIGWKWKKLSGLSKIIGGGTPSKQNQLFYNNGDILWASVRDMNIDIIEDTELKITQDALKGSSSNIIPKGNLVIATRVGLGKICKLKYDTAINQDLKGIIPNNNIDVDYLFFWFKSIASFIIENGTGATVKGVKLDFINNLEIPLPPLPEQHRIVNKLDTLFENIDKAITLSNENLTLANNLLPATLNEVFENAEEKGWKSKTIKDVCKIVGGGTPSKQNEAFYKNGTILWASVRDMNVEEIEDTELKITQDALKDSSSNIIPKGNLIIATRVGLGKVCKLKFDTAINQDLKGIIPNKNIDVDYLFFWFKSIGNLILENGTGATVKGVKLDFINGLIIPVPDLPIQQKIINHLNAISAQQQQLQQHYTQQLQQLKALKASLLNAAFKGEL